MQLYFLFIKCLTKNFRKELSGGVYKNFPKFTGKHLKYAQSVN